MRLEYNKQRLWLTANEKGKAEKRDRADPGLIHATNLNSSKFLLVLNSSNLSIGQGWSDVTEDKTKEEFSKRHNKTC